MILIPPHKSGTKSIISLYLAVRLNLSLCLSLPVWQEIQLQSLLRHFSSEPKILRRSQGLMHRENESLWFSLTAEGMLVFQVDIFSWGRQHATCNRSDRGCLTDPPLPTHPLLPSLNVRDCKH